MSWLHTDGRYIKDVSGRVIQLRGCDFLEPAYMTDKLRHDHTLEQRAQRMVELGVNLVRLEVDYEKWNANLDTNGDGVGNRDFTMQAVEAMTNRGLRVIPGLHGSKPSLFYTDSVAWANWIAENLVEPFLDNSRVVGVYIMNEPPYAQFGGDDLGGGVTSGYWEAVKHVCARVHEVNPNLLVIAHGDMLHGRGFSPVLETDPIPTPNIVYTWHYYYSYCPAFNPYYPWGSLDPDPTYEDCKERGQPYYQYYGNGDYVLGRGSLEQVTYNKFIRFSTELNIPIILDEFGFNGDEMPYFSRRKCPNGDWEGKVNEAHDEFGSLKGPPFTGTVYCPVDGAAIPQPAPYAEPGFSQCFKDYLDILNSYGISWSYFAWWVKSYGGYGLVEDDMTTLSSVGVVWKDYLLAPEPPSSPLTRIILPAIGAIAYAGLGYSTGGIQGAAIFMPVGLSLGYIASLIPPALETTCIECGGNFIFTTYEALVWCPKCGEEQVIKKEGVK